MEKRIKAGQFKAICLKLMDEVSEKQSQIVITKRDKPVAKLVPADSHPKSLFGAMKGSLSISDDIIEPIGEDWDAAL